MSVRQRHGGEGEGASGEEKSGDRERSHLGTGVKGTPEVSVVLLQPFPESDIHQSESWGQTAQGSGGQTLTAACLEARGPRTSSEAQPRGSFHLGAV